jgi:hypothetical protein
MVSSDDLLLRKKMKIEDVNYNTQDRDFVQHQNYHTLGHENDRPSAMQTQTIILPYNDIPVNNTIQPNVDHYEESSQNEQSQRERNPNEQDVDHRFSSEEDENPRNNSDKEEVKMNVKYSPNLFERSPKKLENPYMDRTQNIEKQDRPNLESRQKSEIEEIHEFMDECREELKSSSLI